MGVVTVAVEHNEHSPIWVKKGRGREVFTVARVVYAHIDRQPGASGGARGVKNTPPQPPLPGHLGRAALPYAGACRVVCLAGTPCIGSIVRVHKYVGPVWGTNGLRVVGLCCHRHLHTRARLHGGVRAYRGGGGGMNDPAPRQPYVQASPAVKIRVVGVEQVGIHVVP
jgi:hypothetical protein